MGLLDLNYKSMNITLCLIAGLSLVTSFLLLEQPLKTKLSRKKYQNKTYQEVIKKIDTPKKANNYTTNYLEYTDDWNQYNSLDYSASFEKIHLSQEDDCDGGAVAAAALLEDDGYPPLIMTLMRLGDRQAHAVYVYEKEGKWGSIGINKMDWSRPKYDSLNDLAASYEIRYSKFPFFDAYYVTNLNETCPNYKNSDENLARCLDPIYFSDIKFIYQK